MAGAELERVVTAAREAHAELLADLDRLVATGRLDVAGASGLPGWTRAHLLAHLARNADSHRRMIEGAGRSEVVEQYEGGVEGRTAGIDAGVGRAPGELVDDVRAASTALELAWAATDWQGGGRRTLTQVTPIVELPFLRLREVALHHVDLDIGRTFDDLPALYVRLELRRREMAFRARLPMGMTGLPPRALELAPARRVAWLTGRLDVDGLPHVDF